MIYQSKKKKNSNFARSQKLIIVDIQRTYKLKLLSAPTSAATSELTEPNSEFQQPDSCEQDNATQKRKK